MSHTITLYPTTSAFITKDAPDTNRHDINSIYVPLTTTAYLLLGFPGIPSEYQYRGYTSSLYILGHSTNSYFPTWNENVYETVSFNPETVTYNSSSKYFSNWKRTGAHNNGTFAVLGKSPEYLSLTNHYYAIANAATDGLIMYGSAASEAYKPYIVAVFDDEDAIITPSGSPKSGWLNRNTANTFSWVNIRSKNTIAVIEQQSAVFRWREENSSAWTEIAISGNTTNYVMPSDVMPSGKIQWQVSVTDINDNTTESPVYTIITEDTEAIATPISPINTIETGDQSIILKWSITNSSGSTPTGSDVEISTDGNTWSSLAHISGSITEYEVAAGTFLSGTNYWRVRAYNADGVAGQYSDAVSFLSVASPPEPVVSSNNVPFSTISWQSIGQLAWKLEIDGNEIASGFGTDTSYSLSDYLSNGEHIIKVFIQGQYGLWSQAGVAVSVINNEQGDSVELSGNGAVDADLSWVSSSTSNDWLIYRDGKRVGHTNLTSYSDRYVLGSHVYQVLNKLQNGNYTLSNIININLDTEYTIISAFPDIRWEELRLNESSAGEQVFTNSNTMSLRHFYGSSLPVLERSPYEDGVAGYEVSFLNEEQSKTIESLRGKPVIIKSRRGNVVVGVISDMRKRETNFYTSISFDVQKIYWEDYRNDTLD